MHLMGLRGRIRDGAALTFGFDEVEAENLQLRDRFVEAHADARMIARAAEDLSGWQGVSAGTGPAYTEQTPVQRREEVRQAYLYYFNDPVVGRTVDLLTNYAFAKGVRKPVYRDNADGTVDEVGPGQKHLDRFWSDDFNQTALFDVEAQRAKSTELQLQANIFLLLLSPEDQAPGGPDGEEFRTAGVEPDVPTRIADLPQGEIVDVIMHPGHRKIPLYYKRQYTPRVYDFSGGELGNGVYKPGTPKVVYYRDWRFGDAAPTEWDGEPWGPDPERIATGHIYHIAVNKTSEMKFGVPGVKRYMKWARALNDYMHSRVNLVQAIAQIAMRAKVKGGPRHVQQVRGTMETLTKAAEALEGTTDLNRHPAADRQTKVAVENPGVDLQPNVTDTNSGGAVNDISTMLAQVAAGSGVGKHHLGGDGPNLSTTTSMDAPLQRLTEGTQELWKGVYTDLSAYELKRGGYDPSVLSMKMPPILSRDVAVISQVVIGLMGAVDPNVDNRDLVRWSVGEVLDAMGIDNVNELLDLFFPEGWVSPMKQSLAVAEAQMKMQVAAQGQIAGMGAPGAEEGAEGAEGARANFDAGQQAHDKAIKNGRRTVGTDSGSATAIQASQDRSRHRQERSLATPAEAGTVDGTVEDLVEDLTGAGQRDEALAVLRDLDLPPALREVGQSAIALLEAPVDAADK